MCVGAKSDAVRVGASGRCSAEICPRIITDGLITTSLFLH
jgi:hypothetical protein